MASGLTTLVVGIDGACRGVLDPMFDDGVVPTLQRLFETGASGPLESQVPPWTASAWPSLYTGTNPGKHGVFDFLTFDGYDWEVVDATDVRQPPLWRLADHHGLSSVVVNVPVTHPSGEFDGALVPGYAAPEDPTCHPSGLLDELREAIGEYRVYPEHTGETGVDDERIVSEHVTLAGMRGRAFQYLAERFDPDFGFLEFQGTDSTIHELPGDRDALRRIYGAVDETVAGVIEACDPETVVVASDHGVGSYEGYDVRVNDALADAGLLETTRGGSGMPTWATVRDRQLADGEDETAPERGLGARAMAALARAGLTSQRAAAVLEPLGLDETVARFVPTEAISAGTEQVDFAASRAYMRSRVECGVRVNLEGREPDGVVPPEEYEAARQRVIDRLGDLETPDGEPAFETVARRERFFDGSAAEDAVDVVTVPAGFDHLLSSQLRGRVFGDLSESWNHKRTGVVAVSGPGIDPAPIVGAHLFDVAPTVLSTMGLPVAERMDGSVLPPVEPTGVEACPDLEIDQAGTDDDGTAGDRSGTVEDRLADLGYIE